MSGLSIRGRLLVGFRRLRLIRGFRSSRRHSSRNPLLGLPGYPTRAGQELEMDWRQSKQSSNMAGRAFNGGPIMFCQLMGLYGFGRSMAGMVRMLVILAVAFGGGLLGALGLYTGP